MKALRLLPVILLLALLSGCKAAKVGTTTTTRDSVVVVYETRVRDSVRIVTRYAQRDSIVIRDSVVLVVDTAGKVLQTSRFSARDAFRDTDREMTSEETKASDTSISEEISHNQEKVEVVERRQSWWDRFKNDIIIGLVLLALFAALIYLGPKLIVWAIRKSL